MKILYLISGTNMGGATLSFLTLVDFVKKRGDCPFVVIPDSNSGFIDLLKQKNIPFFIEPLNFFCYPSKDKRNHIKRIIDIILFLFHELQNRTKINKIVKAINPDIIHTNVGPLATGHFVARKRGLPHIWHIREYGDLDFNLHFFPSKKFFHKLLNQDTVISITQDLIHYNKLENNKKAFVVYNGVREKNKIHNIFPKSKYFLCASRVSPEKGQDDIIKGFAKFHEIHSDYKLIILGDGNDLFISSLKELAKKLNCEDAVIFKGYVQNVSDYMQKATALLVGSHFEGFGRMTAEACFDGCVVIGKNSGGTKEILSQTGGFLYNSQDEMLDSMEKVIAFPEETYHSLVQKAQQKAQELFSIKNYTEKIYSIYIKTLEN